MSVATGLLLAILGVVGWLAVRHIGRAADLAARLESAKVDASRAIAGAVAIAEHKTPADVAASLDKGTF